MYIKIGGKRTCSDPEHCLQTWIPVMLAGVDGEGADGNTAKECAGCAGMSIIPFPSSLPHA